MKIDISGDALRLLDHFIYYGTTYPEHIADAMWYNLSSFKSRLLCLDKAFQVAMAKTEHKTTARPKKEQPALPADFDQRFPEPVGGMVREWLMYKTERADYYSPTGLRNLLAQIENQAKLHSAGLIANLISECMANNWAGIIWDRIKRHGVRLNGQRNAGYSDGEPSSSEIIWGDFLRAEHEQAE